MFIIIIYINLLIIIIYIKLFKRLLVINAIIISNILNLVFIATIKLIVARNLKLIILAKKAVNKVKTKAKVFIASFYKLIYILLF